MVMPRLIPVVTLMESRAVKTKNFSDPKYVGDPANTVALLSHYEVEELLVIDISSSYGQTPTSDKILEQLVENAFMPIGFGGGIKNVSGAKRIFDIGFDKVMLRTNLLNSNLASKIAGSYGEQAVSGCLDVTYPSEDKKIMIVNGKAHKVTECTNIVSELSNSGIGELVVQDIQRDGTRQGFREHPMLTHAIEQLNIPVIPLGGGHDVDGAASFLERSKCHSVAASTMFLFRPTRDAILVTYPDIDDWHASLNRSKK